MEKIKTLSYLKRLKEEENLKTKATCVQIQYLQSGQIILSQLNNMWCEYEKHQKRCCSHTRKTSRTEKIKCSYPAGASSYCNHIIALLFEIADYSL